MKNYNKKRDFSKTPEPKGIKKKPTQKNRFVIQFHKARTQHFDFRLEHDGKLLSWAIPKGLSYNINEKRLAIMVEDHPLEYINFSGEIPKGNYGAGTVEIFDKGTYKIEKNMQKSLENGQLKLELNGKKIKGKWHLINTKNSPNWLMIKIKDKFAQDTINKGIPFKKCSVELATLSQEIPTGKNWIFEIKYDGYRILCFSEKNKIKLITRNGLDHTKKLSFIAENLAKIEQNSFVLDGEIVVFDKSGKSDFSLLQNSLKNNKKNIYYVIFDILVFNGEDVRNLPLENRKKILEINFKKLPENLILSDFVKNGKKSFEFAKKMNLEGIMAKNINSLYSGKRTQNWLKIKCYKRQEFIILGFTKTQKNPILSAILLGYYLGEKLMYVGKVGTGLTDADRESLFNKLSKIKTQKPCINSKLKNVIWVEPKLVVEIQYVELTPDNLLRQPSFIGLRQDKNPKEIFLEV